MKPAGSPFSIGHKPSGNAFQTLNPKPVENKPFNFKSQEKDEIKAKVGFQDQNLFETAIK